LFKKLFKNSLIPGAKKEKLTSFKNKTNATIKIKAKKE